MPRPAPTKASKPRSWPSLAHGDGSWSWDPERGCCELRYVFADGRRLRERGATPAECLAQRRERLEQYESAQERHKAISSEMTMGDLFAKWLSFRGGVAPQTRSGYEWTWSVIEPMLGGKLAADVTVAELGSMFAAVIADGQRSSKATIAKIRSLLVMMFDHGVAFGHCATNPMKTMPKAAMPTGASAAREISWLDRDEFARMRELLSRSRSTTYRAAMLVQLLCGLRPGEALGLRWDAVDFDAGLLHVRSQLQQSQGGRVLQLTSTLKTKASRRTVQMPADLVAVLRAERQAQRERKMAARSWGDDQGLAFTTDEGAMLDFANYRRATTASCASAKAKTISPNGLRHSFGSQLVDRGVSLAEVARVLGHTDLRMVSTVYVHALDNVPATASVLELNTREAASR